MGRWVTIDKQPIGFKGAHELELCIRDKSEGGDYQYDVIVRNCTSIPFSFFTETLLSCQKCLVSYTSPHRKAISIFDDAVAQLKESCFHG